MLAQLKVASVASWRLFSRLSASLMKQSPCKHHKKSLCLWQSDADLWSGKCDRVTELSSCHISLSYCTFPLLTVRNGLWQLWLVLARHFSERAKSFGSIGWHSWRHFVALPMRGIGPNMVSSPETPGGLSTRTKRLWVEVLDFWTSGHFRFKSKLEDSLLKTLNHLKM